MTYKAVAFDLDGTLVTEKSSWWKLHEYFGTKQDSIKNMQAYEQKRITYDEFMKLDISLWKPRPHVNTIKKILLSYHLTPNSKLATKTLNDKGFALFIVTTAPSILANAVASELNIFHVVSNELLFDKDGYITEETVFNVDLMKKEDAFEKLLTSANIRCSECIAVGDSKYDIGFLNKSGLGVAYDADEILRAHARLEINDMIELLQII
jgi:phosphoserine phosphatase